MNVAAFRFDDSRFERIENGNHTKAALVRVGSIASGSWTLRGRSGASRR